MTTPVIVPITAPLPTLDGQLGCDWCPAVYSHPYVIDHPESTPRQQLRQAASRDGWKQTSGGLETCPACAADRVAFLIPGWTVFWTPDRATPAPVQQDPEATAIVPLRRLNTAERRTPYPPVAPDSPDAA
jgi:hypothetical protein